MRVRIAYSVHAPDWYRREINRYYGREGLATRDQVRDWFMAYGNSMDDDLAVQADQADRHEEETS